MRVVHLHPSAFAESRRRVIARRCQSAGSWRNPVVGSVQHGMSDGLHFDELGQTEQSSSKTSDGKAPRDRAHVNEPASREHNRLGYATFEPDVGYVFFSDEGEVLRADGVDLVGELVGPHWVRYQ